MKSAPPTRSVHCLNGRHELCQDGARIRCTCPCGHRQSEYPKTCFCGMELTSWAVANYHARVDHDGVTYTTYRDDIDSWQIEIWQEGESVGHMAFSSEAARNEAWRVLCEEDLADPRTYA